MKLAQLRGKWALVTGASSGIGREIALHLAREGVNLVLVARREDRLRALAAEALAQGPIDTCVIAQDLGEVGAAARIRTATAGRGIMINLLVNNAAFGHWGNFETATSDTYRRMIDVNVTAMVELCQVFLPDLLATAPSVVINVASQAAYQPVPYMATYAASKAFVLSFSQALHGEWGPRGVLVQALVPGPTETEFDTVAGAFPSALQSRGSAKEVAQACLRGLERGAPVAASVKGIWKQRLFAGLFPPRVVIREVAKMFRPANAKSSRSHQD